MITISFWAFCVIVFLICLEVVFFASYLISKLNGLCPLCLFYPSPVETLKRLYVYLVSKHIMGRLFEESNFLSDDMQRFVDLLSIEIYNIDISRHDLHFVYNLVDRINAASLSKETAFSGVNPNAVYNDDNFICQISWGDLNLTESEWKSLERVKKLLEAQIS